MDSIRYLRAFALRQFRHNTDNSPSLLSPKDGFVYAYDMELVERYVIALEEELDELQARINSAISKLTNA